ncbi:MAG TPA: LPS assembly lipoprotein LptE [Rhizomicrobium sp.]|nr:LPS assembly lipoprotein LptE [Rhizomicrobium sp.]
MMKRPFQIAMLAGLCLALAACGFRPLYGRYSGNPAATAMFESTYVEPVPDRVGYELRNTMIDLLRAKGSADGARYRLKLTFRELQIPIAVQNVLVGTLQETITTRYNYRLTVNYELTAVVGNASITKGSEDALASYNVTADASGMYSTQTAYLEAQTDAARDIATRLRTDLAVFLDTHPAVR